MLHRYQYRSLEWIDLESPTKDEVRALIGEFKIDPFIGEELLLPSSRSRVETSENCIYLILHFPAIRHSHTSDTAQEIDFLIGRSFIITTHYDTIDPLHKFSRVFEVNSMLSRSEVGTHAGFLFYYMLKHLYASTVNELESVHHSLRHVEQNVFAGREKEMVFALSKVSKTLLDIRQTLVHHRDVLDSFDETAKEFFGTDFGRFSRRLISEYRKIENIIRNHTALLSELRETNNSLLNTKQTEVMKLFTIMAFVTFPLALAVEILMFDSPTNPLTKTAYDFWIILGFVVGASLVMFLFFKHKKWL